MREVFEIRHTIGLSQVLAYEEAAQTHPLFLELLQKQRAKRKSLAAKSYFKLLVKLTVLVAIFLYSVRDSAIFMWNVVFSAVLIIGISIWSLIDARKFIRGEKGPDTKHEIATTINSIGIKNRVTISGKEISEEYPWTSVDQFFDTKNYIFINRGEKIDYLSKGAFKDPGEVEEFLEQAKNWRRA
ncbi:MAG TPA: YcxB family protein [Patescibacteria group bacterium]|nr:YcxB family protein [Patescibacteria group bacterium]